MTGCRLSSLVKKLRGGFTLLEVVVSLGILTMSTLSILGLTIYSAKLGRQTEARTTALSIARSQIDQILAISQSNRGLVTDKPIVLPPDLQSQMPGSSLSASYSVNFVAGTSNLQQIEVTVRWRNATGNSNAPFSSVSACKVISSPTNMSYNPYIGPGPHTTDELFYTPPPPPPPPTTTGSSTGSTTSSTSGTTGTVDPTTGSTSSTGGSSGSSTGTSTSTGTTTASTTGSGGSTVSTGFSPGSGTKWK